MTYVSSAVRAGTVLGGVLNILPPKSLDTLSDANLYILPQIPESQKVTSFSSLLWRLLYNSGRLKLKATLTAKKTLH